MRGGVDQAELVALLEQARSNRLRIYVTLTVVLAALTGVLLDAFWLPWATTLDRMAPFLGLVVVCIGGLWFANRMARENAQLKERILVLVEGLTGAAQERLSRGQQEALEVQLWYNRRLAFALVGVGVFGALSLAVAMVLSVDRVLDNFWTAVAVLAVAGVCLGLALWWAVRGRRIARGMDKMGNDGNDADGK